MIDGEMLERAERSLIQARSFVPEDRILFDRAFCQQDALERFIQHHMTILVQHSPSLDPTLEPSLNTMFRHMFLVGAVAGRENALQG